MNSTWPDDGSLQRPLQVRARRVSSLFQVHSAVADAAGRHLALNAVGSTPAALHAFWLQSPSFIRKCMLHSQQAALLGVQGTLWNRVPHAQSLPGGWWTGTVLLLVLYCIYEQISFATSR